MGILGKAHAAGWVLIAASAAAQAAKPDAEAAAAAAMERAKRQAAGPMRIILEASKARRKGTDLEAAAVAEPAARAAPVRATSAASAPAAASDSRLLVAAAASGATAPNAARAPMESEAEPAQPPAQTATAPPVATPPVEPPSPMTLSSEFLRTNTLSAAVPSLDVTATAPIAGAAVMLQPALPQATVLAAPSPPVTALMPRLVTMVEPDLPQRLLDQLGRNATVRVDLNIRANGSVASVTVLPPSPRQLERVLAAALEQWKFDPLPANRVHRVELVFNPER